MTTNHKHKAVFEAINLAYKQFDNIAIIIHVNPDGDAVGSALGLFHFLKKMKKNVSIIAPNDFPDFLSWMIASNEIIRYNRQTEKAVQIIENADLIFFLDFNDIDRVPKIDQHVKQSKAVKILIDHHPNPTDFVDIMLSEIEVSSTAELVCDLILNSNEKILLDKTIAECLFAGILT